MRCKNSYLGNHKHFMLLNDSILTFLPSTLPTYLKNISLECASELDRDPTWRNLIFLLASILTSTVLASFAFTRLYKTVTVSEGFSPFPVLWFSFPFFFFPFRFWTKILNEIWVINSELTRASRFMFIGQLWGFFDSWGSFGLFFRSCQKKYLGPRLGRDARYGSPGQGWETSICPGSCPYLLLDAKFRSRRTL